MTAPKPCPTGKVPLDAPRAQQLARRSSAAYTRPMTAYKCPECGAWHLGGTSRPYRQMPIINNNHHQLNLRPT